MTLIELTAVTVSAGGLFAGWYFRHRTERLRKYRECAEHFYAKARPLLDDPDTPASALTMLEFMNWHITDRNAARSFVRSLAYARANGDEVSKMRRRARFADLDVFFANREGLKHAFAECMAAGLLAISFNSGPIGIWGWLARRGVLGAVEAENEIAPGVVRTYARREKRRQPDHSILEPAA